MPIMNLADVESYLTDQETTIFSYRTEYVETRYDADGEEEGDAQNQWATTEIRFGRAARSNVAGGIEMYVQTTDFNWIIPLRLGPDEALKLAQDMVDEITRWKANHPHG